MIGKRLTLVNQSGRIEPFINVLCAGSSAVEQETLNLLAVGSIPTQRTKKRPRVWSLFMYVLFSIIFVNSG